MDEWGSKMTTITNGRSEVIEYGMPPFFSNGHCFLRGILANFFPSLRGIFTRVVPSNWLYGQSFTTGAVTRTPLDNGKDKICVHVEKAPWYDYHGTHPTVVVLIFEVDRDAGFDCRLGYRWTDGEIADFTSFERYILYVGFGYKNDYFIRGPKVYAALDRVC